MFRLLFGAIGKYYKLINPRISIDEINYGRRRSKKNGLCEVYRTYKF